MYKLLIKREMSIITLMLLKILKCTILGIALAAGSLLVITVLKVAVTSL